MLFFHICLYPRLIKDYPTREIVVQSLDDDYGDEADNTSTKVQAM